jgi:hypothetical protein
MRLLSRAASSTSQAQISERAELGESTKTTVFVGLANQVAEASFPVLTTGDAVTVDETLEVVERRIELVSEVQVVAAVGDEDAKLPFIGRCRPTRLLGGTSGFRRSWTGCVMRNVCHSTAPMRAD